MNRVGTIRSVRLRRTSELIGATAAAGLIVVVGLFAGTGWLYVLRDLHWLGAGPRVSDSLPLLQLAGFDGQPLLRVLVAWMLAGAVTGVALIRIPATSRAALALVLGVALLLLASQASYALARNLRFSDVVLSRAPGLGPLVEGVAFALGCWLARPAGRRQRGDVSGRARVPILGGLRDRRLRSRQDRNGAEDDGDRRQVDDHHAGVSA